MVTPAQELHTKVSHLFKPATLLTPKIKIKSGSEFFPSIYVFQQMSGSDVCVGFLGRTRTQDIGIFETHGSGKEWLHTHTDEILNKS